MTRPESALERDVAEAADHVVLREVPVRGHAPIGALCFAALLSSTERAETKVHDFS